VADQWQNFLGNLGTWRGSFTGLGPDGQEQDSTPSILSLTSDPGEERLVHFRLRRFADQACSGEPLHDLQQDYRSLGRQVVFFDSGTFCKGSLQIAPGSSFGAEFGFIHADRRHRLVQLHNADGHFDKLVLIREFREGSAAVEEPMLTPAALSGSWCGTASTINADWPEPELDTCQVEIQTNSNGALNIRETFSQTGQTSAGDDSHMTWMADGGYHRTPFTVSHRESFCVEAGWLVGGTRLERLIRRYDRTGAWLSATQIIATRA
jgi:hypothetical protein